MINSSLVKLKIKYEVIILIITYLVINFILIVFFKKKKKEVNKKKFKVLFLLWIVLFISTSLFYFSCDNKKTIPISSESEDLTIEQTLSLLDLSDPGAKIETEDGDVFILYSWEQTRFLTVYKDGELNHFNLNDDIGLQFFNRIKDITNKIDTSSDRKSELIKN